MGRDSGRDSDRWNARYAGDFTPSFEPHPLAVLALSMETPGGPVLDLACGTSGSVLLAAESGRCGQSGRSAVGVDVSDVALKLLGAEVRRRGLGDRVGLVRADLTEWRPEREAFAVVLCTGYWDRSLFPAAAQAVVPGGLLGWEALTLAALDARPGMPADWCVRAGEPASLLPDDWDVVSEEDVPRRSRRRLLARKPR